MIRYIGVLFDAFSELAKAPEPESIKKRSIGFIKPEKKQESREQLSQKNDAFFQMQRVVILKRTWPLWLNSSVPTKNDKVHLWNLRVIGFSLVHILT